MKKKSRIYHAKRIGHLAAKLLNGSGPAWVRGTTSGGVYVQTSTRWVVFLSVGRFLGPLTITLDRSMLDLLDMPSASPAEVSDGRLVFPEIGAEVVAGGAPLWTVPDRPGELAPYDRRRQAIRFLAERAVAEKKGLGFSGFWPPILNLPPAENNPAERGDVTVLQRVQAVQRALERGEVNGIVDPISSLLGVGRGLTPSGDDFSLGMLLALNRWATDLLPAGGLAGLKKSLVELAYERTTRLSANLIECASQGEADERLLHLVDSMFCGHPSPAESAEYMLKWGASSGVDASLGMGLVGLAYRKE